MCNLSTATFVNIFLSLTPWQRLADLNYYTCKPLSDYKPNTFFKFNLIAQELQGTTGPYFRLWPSNKLEKEMQRFPACPEGRCISPVITSRRCVAIPITNTGPVQTWSSTMFRAPGMCLCVDVYMWLCTVHTHTRLFWTVLADGLHMCVVFLQYFIFVTLDKDYQKVGLSFDLAMFPERQELSEQLGWIKKLSK